ncbi:MAG: xylulokinase [Halioglobus sp.]
MYLGIDLGTQSVKAIIYDAQARAVVAQASSSLDMISAADGTQEQMAHWWVIALHQCLARLDAKHKAAVKAVAVSGQQHGLVALDDTGAVLSPVKLWCDTTTALECDEITRRFGGVQKLREEVGNEMLTGYTAPKIRWLARHKPQRYAQVKHFLLPHDYLNFYLTGEAVMEHGDASGTGLLDIRTRQWHSELLQAIDPDRDLAGALPPLVESNTQIGTVKNDVAELLGLPAGVAVAAGGGDNMLAAIGTGNVVPGKLTMSLGTSGTLFTYSDTPVIDPQGEVAAFCSSTGGWLPLLCTMNCTVATELTRQQYGLTLAESEKLIAKAPVGSEGILTIPYFNGERTPNLPEGKAVIAGLDALNYSQGNMLRSAMEGATFALRNGLDAFTRLDCELSEICLTGGGAGSAAWRQMVADVFNRPVKMLANDEGAAMGAALQAMWMYQGGDIGAWVVDHLVYDSSRAAVPDAERVSQYQEVYERYQAHSKHVVALYS